MSPTREEFEVRFLVIEQITRAIHAIWPSADVTPFGSWQTQLYLPHGQVADKLIGDCSWWSVTSIWSWRNRLRKAIKSGHYRIWRERCVNPKSQIQSPLFRKQGFQSSNSWPMKVSSRIKEFSSGQLIVGKLNVDISLNQVNGIAAGKIVNQYLDILPGARQMILVVKAFLSQRSMNEVYSGGLGSYSVICLVISFLQVCLG